MGRGSFHGYIKNLTGQSTDGRLSETVAHRSGRGTGQTGKQLANMPHIPAHCCIRNILCRNYSRNHCPLMSPIGRESQGDLLPSPPLHFEVLLNQMMFISTELQNPSRFWHCTYFASWTYEGEFQLPFQLFNFWVLFCSNPYLCCKANHAAK